jgi:NitT/TauT family transport system substrate-binding protein
VALAAAATGAGAEGLSLQLNWTAGGDHAPVYYAQAQGWYAAAGVDLDIREGSGSGASATALEVGQAEVAIIDTPTALQFLAKGAPLNGIFVAYNDNAAGLYWKRSSGIATVADLAGKKIGAPAFDATRQMWTPYAAAIGVNADSVEWVNVQPTGKIAALQSGAIDATTHFYSVHFIYEDIFGDDLGFALIRNEHLRPGLFRLRQRDCRQGGHDPQLRDRHAEGLCLLPGNPRTLRAGAVGGGQHETVRRGAAA